MRILLETKHFLDSGDLERSINLLLIANEIVRSLFKGEITKAVFVDNKDLFDRINAKTDYMSKSTFRQIIADVSYIEEFEVEKASQQFNRLDPKEGIGLRFGVVVTLKEIHCVNRIDEFVRNCHLSGWLVNTIDIQNRVDIYEKVNEEIEFS